MKTNSSIPVLSEEGSISDYNIRKNWKRLWIVDPLDGTSNFLREIPICCVSIALMHKTKAILGVIYDFNHDDLYYGHQGSKAYVNYREIKVSSLSQKNMSTLVTGIPAKTHYTDIEFQKMISNFPIK